MAEPQLDEVLGADNDMTVIQAVNAFREQSRQARVARLAQNRTNRDVYLGRQDWSHKNKGQSKEFLPKVPISIEQMGAFIKKALVSYGAWFDTTVDHQLEDILDSRQITALLRCFLDNLWLQNNKSTNIATILSDTIKIGMMESLMILKVHGAIQKTRKPVFERGKSIIELGQDNKVQEIRGDDRLNWEDSNEWRLRVDMIRPEDYYPDPTGNGLFEIHRVEKDLHEVLRAAENGMYNETMVKMLRDQDYPKEEDESRTERDRAQEETVNPQFRKRVVIDEFWGTLLNADGSIYMENVVCAIANDKYLIRKPEPNPFWHQESPFIAEPLIRVPFSVWHKALYDHASELNLAINEMFNLMLDGGIAAVWGTRQIRLEDLEDPSQVSGGIPQGTTLAVKSTIPHGAKVLENVTEGDVPQDAMQMFEFLNREFTQAALTNELKLGALPPKEVRATEVVEASQSQALTLEGITTDVENNVINRLLRLSFLTILQNADKLPQDVLLGVMDKKTALLLLRASPEERYAMLAGRCKFQATGLTGTLARMRDFQRMMALFQAISQMPLLLQAFQRRFSPDRALIYMIRTLQLNPDTLEKNAEELAQLDEEMARTMQAQQMIAGGGEQGGLGGGAGEPGMTSDINQQLKPVSGMTPNA